jgi:hypothetical protein
VGGLRLLKQDPFHDVLAERGWLHILDPLYVEEVRAALRQALPPKPRPVTRLRPEPVWVPQPAAVPGRMQAATQPGLFEHAS